MVFLWTSIARTEASWGTWIMAGSFRMWLGPPHGGQPTQDAERAGRSILTEAGGDPDPGRGPPRHPQRTERCLEGDHRHRTHNPDRDVRPRSRRRSRRVRWSRRVRPAAPPPDQV